MTESSVLPASMSLREWDRLDLEGAAELVQGVPVMSPSEVFIERLTSSRTTVALSQVPGVDVVQEMDVLISDDGQRPTVRCPDLVVVEAGVVGDVPRLQPADVLLVVEIVSESSGERDWVTKRREYAAAGIPAYLVIDRHQGRLALFDRLVDGRYVDPTSHGPSVSVRLGDESVEVALDDLLP